MRHFFIVGAPRCGTTSLYAYMRQHPDVAMSRPKEPLFIEREYELGRDHYVRTYFGEVTRSVLGEARAMLLYLPFAPERLAATFPDARIVALLRDPVERAFSHWRLRFSAGTEDLEFGEAVARNLEELRENPDRFQGPSGAEEWRTGFAWGADGVPWNRHRTYIDAGSYGCQLERYLEHFGPDRMRVVSFRRFTADPAAVVRGIHDFLGLDPTPEVSVLPPKNFNAGRRGERLRKIGVALGLRKLLPSRARSAMNRLLFRARRRPALDPSVRSELEAYYREDRALLDRLAREGILDHEIVRDLG